MMIRKILEKFRFSEIRKDRWLDSVRRLPKRDSDQLRRRRIAFFIYRGIRFCVLLPVSTLRMVVHLVQFLSELDRLHFSPLRKIRRGKDCVIDKQTWLTNGQNIHLGDFVKLSAFSTLIAGTHSTIKIGTNTIIGPGVTIVSINHGMNSMSTPIRYQKWIEESVQIGDDVWIGANVVILPGATIGNGCVIGAGAIIKGNIPTMTITYCGNRQLKIVQRK